MKSTRALVVTVFAFGAFGTLGALGALAGCKGDIVQCEKACRNYATLTYWEQASAKLASAPEGQREEMRKTLADKFETDMKGGIDVCSTQCASANNGKDIDCMIEAKTAAAVKACVTN